MVTFETSHSDRQNVVVVIGAGIGGLTAGLELAHAGFRVIIVERSPVLSEAGAGIQISPNAGRVLSRIGLDRAIAARSSEPTAIEAWDGHGGKRLAVLPGQVFRELYRFPYRIIHRADLQAALLEGCAKRTDVTIMTGASVTEVSETVDNIAVTVTKDGDTARFEAIALVAADGVRSTTRRSIAGASTPVPIGMTAWRTTIPAAHAQGIVDLDRVTVWLGRNGHVVHYPVSQGDALNIVAIVPEKWDADDWSAPGDPAVIAQRFGTWNEKVRRVIGAASSWQKYAISTVDPAGAWTQGRIALLGDAAHAMQPFLAQGAAMAMEDAAVLSQHLRRTGDVPRALRAYEEERRKRVGKVAAATAATARAYHAAGPMAVARDIALRLAGTRLMLNRNEWIYRWKPPAP